MPDVMNDEFLVQRDVDPVMGLLLMVVVYIVIPAALWAIATLWTKRRSKR